MPSRPVVSVARDPVDSEAVAAERALVAAVRAGDREAYERVFRAHAAGLTTFVERYVRSPDVAEELVQDLLLAVWRDRARWDPAGSIGGYLYRAARNRAFNWLKRAHIVSAWQTRVGWEVTGESAPPADAATDAR